HKFHEDCVIDWFNASTTCPLCRRNSITLASPADSEVSVKSSSMNTTR
ncbi:Kazal serine protease inhibitor pbraepi2, partial [Globisporangium polare]